MINNPPVFTNTLPISVTIPFNQTYDYPLPPYADPEGNNIIVSIEAIPFGIIN